MNDWMKDAIGRPKWWLTVGVALVLFLGVMVFVERADADTEQVPTCGTHEVKCLAKKRVNQFEAHKLGNAKGKHFNAKAIKRIRNQTAARQVVLRDGCCDWITEPFKAATCFVTSPTGVHQGTCNEGQRSINRITEETRKFTFWCGGAALIGSLKGGGYWGAGRGLLGCTWTRYFMKVFG
jgi:hypothetical protein